MLHLFVCRNRWIHHSRRPHRRSKGIAGARRHGNRSDDVPHVPDCGWQVFVISCMLNFAGLSLIYQCLDIPLQMMLIFFTLICSLQPQA